MAGRFSRRVYGWAKKNKIKVVETKKGDRKCDIAETYIPHDPNFEGVFLVIASRRPATVYHSTRLPGGDFHLEQKSPRPWVRHYHFHIIDRRWGHITISISAHPPFQALIILNGHAYVDALARQRELTYRKDGNCFTEISEPQKLAAIADTLRCENAIGELRHVCDKWIYFCLSFGLSFEDQKRTGIHYDYSLYQLEYSRNLLFQNGRQMDRVVDGVIDRNRSRLDISKIKKIFGRKNRRFILQRKKEVVREELSFEKPAYDLSVFKIHFGKMTIKLYTKGERVLRSEAIINNMHDMPLRRSLEFFPIAVNYLRDCLIRFLNELQAIDMCWINEADLDDFGQGGRLGNTRVGGIDLRAVRSRQVIKALMRLALNPHGFRIGNLAAEINRQRLENMPEYTVRQAAYDLRKFRMKGIVEKKGPKSHVYRCAKSGLNKLSAFVTLEDEIIRPLISRQGLVVSGNARKSEPILDILYKNAQRGIQNLLNHFNLRFQSGLTYVRAR